MESAAAPAAALEEFADAPSAQPDDPEGEAPDRTGSGPDATPAETPPMPGPASSAEKPVRYAPGRAEAATPVVVMPVAHHPTDTKADGFPVPPTQVSNDHHYGEPVDPWATAESRALAMGQTLYVGGPEISDPGAVAARRPRRKWLHALIAVGVTSVLALSAAAVIVYLLPRYPALAFHRLGAETHFPPTVPVSSSWSDGTATKDRFYFASSNKTGAVGVTAVDATGTTSIWSTTVAGTAAGWSGLMALPNGVLLQSAPDPRTKKSRLVVLGPDHGELLWEHLLSDGDDMIFGKTVAVHVDRAGHQLMGLDVTTGRERWRLMDPKGASTTTVPTTTPNDVSGAASAHGRPFAPVLDDDQRIVQITADHAARVVDLTSGTVGKLWQTDAATNDEVVAHNGRLIIRESSNVERIVSYDLGSGKATLLYTAQQDVRITKLSVCGNDWICFVMTTDGDAKQQHVVKLPVVGDDPPWESGPLAGIERLTPVGDSLIVKVSGFTAMLDPSGRTAWTNPGAVVRLDSGNVLRFGHPLSSSAIDDSLSATHLGDEPVELGPIYDVRTDTCAWNTTTLACVTEKDFMTQRFAAGD
ncbi:PQQ-binding-like beta-propeller repeat protein [Krasilnikovia sp. M28-CT-15]|uniref:outer membrane protein assembly factor BamB family protein n=1 Tax=Krasilnikovia sp. M28-CT-15 TaxID=3373540 RepID=UPI00399D040D